MLESNIYSSSSDFIFIYTSLPTHSVWTNNKMMGVKPTFKSEATEYIRTSHIVVRLYRIWSLIEKSRWTICKAYIWNGMHYWPQIIFRWKLFTRRLPHDSKYFHGREARNLVHKMGCVGLHGFLELLFRLVFIRILPSACKVGLSRNTAPPTFVILHSPESWKCCFCYLE